MNLRRKLLVENLLGLHARASAKLVSLASSYPCEVWLEREGRRVNGKSIMGVMLLGAAKGTELVLETAGEQEELCAEAIASLFDDRFGEER